MLVLVMAAVVVARVVRHNYKQLIIVFYERRAGRPPLFCFRPRRVDSDSDPVSPDADRGAINSERELLHLLDARSASGKTGTGDLRSRCPRDLCAIACYIIHRQDPGHSTGSPFKPGMTGTKKS